MKDNSVVAPEAGKLYSAVVLFRVLWTILLVYFVNALSPLGTSPLVVSACGAISVIFTSHLAHSTLNWRAFVLLMSATWIASLGGFWLLDVALGAILPSSFALDEAQLHINTGLLVATIASTCTWIFWRVRIAITLEALLLAAVSIALFAGHRHFHFDRPKLLNSIAWRFGVDHLTMLIAVGSFLLIAGIVYLALASQAARPRAEGAVIRISTTGRNVVSASLLLTLVGLAVYWVQSLLYGHFNAMMLAAVSNGVGMNSEQGVSPLSFQSALGSTNQPAGLVRLEGDYRQNPFSPMLYLRESALSSFNGKELVFAGKAYDTDLSAIHPRESYTGKEDADLLIRTPVVQSIYLLADHENAFSLDYPVSIVQLKNPKPGRFKNTYRAYSVAPAFSMSELGDAKIGDPRWSPEISQHYLKEHPDKRYADLAKELTQDVATPVEKIRSITAYLNRTSIYTLTPNHDTKPEDDPVAPFLFGDHRGYCVHFAHATVYMLRSLGIPARIGTGYLTDLSQAKDGHILLRMSDRHAWAEAYLEGYGWIPFDTQPDNVESHADTQVDTKLLEELMGVLEPGEEILPESSTKNEPGMTDPEELWVPDMKLISRSIAGLLLVLIGIKCALFFGWRLAPTPRSKLRWGYVSLSARLTDSGVLRRFGETRSEYAKRLPWAHLSEVTNLLNAATYSAEGAKAISTERVTEAVKKAAASIKRVPWWKRLMIALNPASVFRLLGGGRW